MEIGEVYIAQQVQRRQSSTKKQQFERVTPLLLSIMTKNDNMRNLPNEKSQESKGLRNLCVRRVGQWWCQGCEGGEQREGEV